MAHTTSSHASNIPVDGCPCGACRQASQWETRARQRDALDAIRESVSPRHADLPADSPNRITAEPFAVCVSLFREQCCNSTVGLLDGICAACWKARADAAEREMLDALDKLTRATIQTVRAHESLRKLITEGR